MCLWVWEGDQGKAGGGVERVAEGSALGQAGVERVGGLGFGHVEADLLSTGEHLLSEVAVGDLVPFVAGSQGVAAVHGFGAVDQQAEASDLGAFLRRAGHGDSLLKSSVSLFEFTGFDRSDCRADRTVKGVVDSAHGRGGSLFAPGHGRAAGERQKGEGGGCDQRQGVAFGGHRRSSRGVPRSWCGEG